MTGLIDAAVVIVVIGFGAAGAIRRLRATQRDHQMPAVAASKGLRFSVDDPFDSLIIDFELFHRGDGRRIENVMWSDADHGPGASQARSFDYGYFDVHHDKSGREVDDWQWFSCAMAEPDGSWPPLHIQRERLRDRALDVVKGDPIQFESEEFNQTFRVTCDDRRLASALVDPQMMQFLLQTKGLVDFVTTGRFVLLISHQLPPDEMPILAGLADEFIRRLPPVVWELYPKVAPAAAPVADPSPAPGPDGVRGSDSSTDPDEAWDPTPGVDYDLDGHPATTATEDPWHDHPLRPHDLRPPDRID
jgi:hypothetical protein